MDPIFKQLISENINKLVDECYTNSSYHGFWDDFNPGGSASERLAVPVKLALIHSEVSEALEGHRAGIGINEKGGLGEELADIVIRCFDLAGRYSIPLGNSIVDKMDVNSLRPRMHGKAY